MSRDEANELMYLIEGVGIALRTEIEEALPQLPWTEQLRRVVDEELEAKIAPRVADVVEGLVEATRR